MILAETYYICAIANGFLDSKLATHDTVDPVCSVCCGSCVGRLVNLLVCLLVIGLIIYLGMYFLKIY